MSPYPRLEDGSEQGLNDFLEYGWSGPCPPNGSHAYRFSLYALDCFLVPEYPRLDSVLMAMENHVLAYAELYVHYEPEGAIASYAALLKGHSGDSHGGRQTLGLLPGA